MLWILPQELYYQCHVRMRNRIHVHFYPKVMLGIIWALETWRHYLKGAKHEIDIWTDDQDLKYFMSTKKLNCWQVHWALFLSQFNFHLTHKVGTLMKKADTLSRQPDHKRGVENDNNNITLLKPKDFWICAMCQGHILIDGLEKETQLYPKLESVQIWMKK